MEKKPDPLDGNPFRYCGEYYDGETKTYYLRARYYDPNIGRFTQQDTHWTTANSIYGDNPQKINEREDKLGLKSYSYAPQITAVMQSGNLYVYGVNNPALYIDENGAFIHILVGAGAGIISAAILNLLKQWVNIKTSHDSNVGFDFVEFGISLLGGAVSGGLTAAGFGAIAAALTSAGTDLATQLYKCKMDFSGIDVGSILTSAALGALGAKISTKVSGKIINLKHLDSMSQACIKRISSTLSGKTFTSIEGLKGAGTQIMKALEYYSTQISKDMLRMIISILKSNFPWLVDLGIDVAMALE